MQADHHYVALHSIQLRDAREESPALKPQLLKQTQTRLVVSENTANQCADSQLGSARNRPLEQPSPNAPTAKTFPHINTHFRCLAICPTRAKRFKTNPA